MFLVAGPLSDLPGVEEVERELLQKYLRPGYSVLEVGAGTGRSTTVIASLVGPAGGVISLEPNPYCIRKLILRIGSLRNVRVLNLAAGEKDGNVDLFFRSAFDSSASLMTRERRRSVRVRMMKVDDIVRLLGVKVVDALVIDAEGSELRVLWGALSTLKRARVLFVEIHHYLEGGLQARVDQVLRSAAFRLSETRLASEQPHITVNAYAKE